MFNVRSATPIEVPIVSARNAGTLLTTAYPLPAGAGIVNGVNRLPAGVKFRPWGCDGIVIGDSELCGAYKLGLDASGNYLPNGLEDLLVRPPDFDYQKSFRLADGVDSSAIDTTHELAREWVNSRLRLQASKVLAHELVAGWAKDPVSDPGGDVEGGVYDTKGNHAFSLDATVLAPANATMKLALVAAEEFLADALHGGEGMIHCSPGILSNVVGDTGAAMVDGVWLTATGHRIVADAGYVGAPQPTGEADPTSAERWIYASGPVWYWIDDPKPVGEANQESMDMTHDDVYAVADRRALCVYDPCAVGAVKVDLTA